MKTLAAVLALCCLSFVGCVAKTLTPELQSEVDANKALVVAWAADPAVVEAVKAQNASGPIAGMTNAKWRGLSDSDPEVRSLEQNAAGLLLSQRVQGSQGKITEAFASGSSGAKAAISDKTTRYFHDGTPKFDVPMSGDVWVGKPGWDKSAAHYAVPIAAPVLDHGKPIGVLVVGVAATKDCGFVWPWDWTWTKEDWD